MHTRIRIVCKCYKKNKRLLLNVLRGYISYICINAVKKKFKSQCVTLWEVPIQGDVFQWAKIELWAPFRW